MKVTHHDHNCATGETRVWEEDVPDGTYLTEAQGIELDKINAATEEKRKSDHAALRATVKGWADNPPQTPKDQAAAIALLAQQVHKLLGD